MSPDLIEKIHSSRKVAVTFWFVCCQIHRSPWHKKGKQDKSYCFMDKWCHFPQPCSTQVKARIRVRIWCPQPYLSFPNSNRQLPVCTNINTPQVSFIWFFPKQKSIFFTKSHAVKPLVPWRRVVSSVHPANPTVASAPQGAPPRGDRNSLARFGRQND